MLGLVFCLPAPGRGQAPAPAPTVATVRQKYQGKKVKITGPLVKPSAGLLYFYGNWVDAKRDAHGRYRPVSDADWAHLSYGAERRLATINAIQRSDIQPKDPWVDIFGDRHPASELGPSFDFIIRFDDDGQSAMCTCSLKVTSACFEVVDAKPVTQN
jgi:hypothetical protein